MKRYKPRVDYEHLYDADKEISFVLNAKGAWVLHREAQAEIQKLESRIRELEKANVGLLQGIHALYLQAKPFET